MNETDRTHRPRRSGPARQSPWGGLRPLRPPEELRARTLAAARGALRQGATEARPPARRALTDRLWESRGLRLAWAAVVVACLAANFLLGRARVPPPPRGGATAPASGLAAIAAPEAAQARLPDASQDRRMTLLESRKILLRRWLEAGDEAPDPKEAPL